MWKSAALTFALAAAAATAQENGPAGLLRGQLVTWSGTPDRGVFTFRASENLLYSCSYDQKTYMEREKQRITFAGVEKGDRLEVISDRQPGSGLCYARTVHIVDVPRAYVVPGVRPRRPEASLAEPPIPRGGLTLTGVVLRITPETLTLKLRSGEHKLIHLRPDTRFLEEGTVASPGTLRASTLVFVRAGKNLEDEVEAFQVVWGGILHPEE